MWPIHPKPFRDELLSSWIARIAHENKIPISKFCEYALLDKGVNQKEIDRYESHDLIKRLSEGTGVPKKQIASMSLLEDEGYIFNFREFGKTMWVIPASSSEASSLTGLTYCPDCYGEDPSAYYRKRWRFSFNPVCAKHKRFLLQRCPSCKKPYRYFQHSSLRGRHTLDACGRCGTKLSSAAPAETADPSLINSILDIQQGLWSGIEAGIFNVSGYAIPSLIYLRVFHSLTNTLIRQDHLRWVIDYFPTDIPEGMDLSRLIDGRYSIAEPEMQRPQESGALMYLTNLLIKDWPSNFEHYFTARELRIRSFLSSTTPPFWITDSCPVISYGKTYRIAPEEKAHASALLATKLRRKPNSRELEHFMETGEMVCMVKARASHRRIVALSPENFTLETNTGETKNPYRTRHDEFRKLASIADKLGKIAVLRKSKKTPVENQNLQIDLFK